MEAQEATVLEYQLVVFFSVKLRSAKLGHFPQKKPIRRSNRRKTHALRCLFERWPRFRGVRSSINEAPLFSLFGAEIEKRELSRNSTLSLSHPLRSHPIVPISFHFRSNPSSSSYSLSHSPRSYSHPHRKFLFRTTSFPSRFHRLWFLRLALLCFLLFKPPILYFIFFFQLALAQLNHLHILSFDSRALVLSSGGVNCLNIFVTLLCCCQRCRGSCEEDSLMKITSLC